MEFEFDGSKSTTNKIRHGINFVEAQAIWEDMDLLEIPAKTADEPRAVVIGKIGDNHWSAIITWRNDKIRIISVTRSRREERELYES
jgi:hypothetical protein